MKWTAILVVVAIVTVFYFVGDRPDSGGDEAMEERIIRSDNDRYDEFEQEDDQPREEPSWQNRRANKIMPLGSNID